MADLLTPTAALRKISALRKPKWSIQGGQGAGKTYSILQILINHASGTPDRDIYVASAELTKMRKTVIKDFVKIMKAFGLFDPERFIGGTEYRFQNGSVVTFLGLDKADIGKGLRSHVVFLNEANKVDFTTYHELTSRADRIIIDYNPNVNFWAHDEVIPGDDCDFLNLTFTDNECLGEAERSTIEGYYRKGYGEAWDGRLEEGAAVVNAFWANMWRVYGLGRTGRLQGAVFENWETGAFDDSLPYGCGLDFGSKDPDACVKVAVDESRKIIYAHELFYKNGLKTRELAELVKVKVPDRKYIVADSAAKRTIDDLRDVGLNVKPVKKNPILQDIKVIQDYTIVVTPESVNLIRELSRYVWLDKTGEIPVDKFNHLLDAFRYIVQTMTGRQHNIW